VKAADVDELKWFFSLRLNSFHWFWFWASGSLMFANLLSISFILSLRSLIWSWSYSMSLLFISMYCLAVGPVTRNKLTWCPSSHRFSLDFFEWPWSNIDAPVILTYRVLRKSSFCTELRWSVWLWLLWEWLRHSIALLLCLLDFFWNFVDD
jgi:hypothetical protein